eukprot:SAG31_NODE_3673_length_3999_cov_2.498974_4_plen_78_part_00
MGRMDEANKAFEVAEEEATRNQYWMLAALAVRDRVKHVLEPFGQLQASDRRVHVSKYTQQLAGSREAMGALLGAEYV